MLIINSPASFTLQKLGKEFDLLRIADNQIINIELKNGNVSNEAIRTQLIQNRYYLSTLGKPVYYYTFISGQDRLVRLSNSGRLRSSYPTTMPSAYPKKKDSE